MRTLVAFLSAPLVVAIGWAAYTFFLADPDSRPVSEVIGEFFVTVVIVYMGAAWATVLVAVPLYFLLRRFDLVRSWTAVFVGALIGGVMGAFLGNLASPAGAFWLGLLGGLAGLVFWHVGGFNARRAGSYAQGS